MLTLETQARYLLEGKKDYEIYHKSLTSAVDEMVDFARKNGFSFDDDDVFNQISNGPKKPSEGKTNRYNMKLVDKKGKVSKKLLHAQVAGLDKSYELNMYIS